MKKFLFAAILVVGGVIGANAQEVGIRFGDVTGGDVAIDGVFSLGQFSRVHGDVSFGNGGVGVDLLWDFLYRPINVDQTHGFYWYVGAGPSVFLNDPLFLSAMSEIGAEYRIPNAPISLSIDWRPTLVIIEETDFVTNFFGFNARYILGQKSTK